MNIFGVLFKSNAFSQSLEWFPKMVLQKIPFVVFPKLVKNTRKTNFKIRPEEHRKPYS